MVFLAAFIFGTNYKRVTAAATARTGSDNWGHRPLGHKGLDYLARQARPADVQAEGERRWQRQWEWTDWNHRHFS